MRRINMKRLTILGSTGSIGTQTLDVVRQNRDKFEVVAISANRSVDLLLEQIIEFKPKYAVLYEKESAEKLKGMIPKEIEIEILDSIDGLVKISTIDEVDIVLTALVGMIGLIPTMKAIEYKKDIALANKETLVTAGEIVMKAAEENNVKILPVDSEHSAIFQCLNGENKKEVNKLILTASGGPFRGKKREELINVTKKQALKHPNWNMGQKISIDSSTLMNKGLEAIGIKDGDRVKVSSRRGEIETTARVGTKVSPGETWMPFHFPDGNANWLTNAALDKYARIPEYKVCAVKVEKA